MNMKRLILLGLSLLRSFVQTVHYEVWHTSTQIGSRGGWLDRFECRVKSDQISFADVRLSPFARLMRRWPVFVTAGSCSPELPLFVYRSGEEALFRELLPEFRMPPDLLARTEQRSLIFFAPAGAPFALCALLTLLSRSTLPGLTVTLLFPPLFFAAGLVGGHRGHARASLAALHHGLRGTRRNAGCTGRHPHSRHADHWRAIDPASIDSANPADTCLRPSGEPPGVRPGPVSNRFFS